MKPFCLLLQRSACGDNAREVLRGVSNQIDLPAFPSQLALTSGLSAAQQLECCSFRSLNCQESVHAYRQVELWFPCGLLPKIDQMTKRLQLPTSPQLRFSASSNHCQFFLLLQRNDNTSVLDPQICMHLSLGRPVVCLRFAQFDRPGSYFHPSSTSSEDSPHPHHSKDSGRIGHEA